MAHTCTRAADALACELDEVLGAPPLTPGCGRHERERADFIANNARLLASAILLSCPPRAARAAALRHVREAMALALAP